GLEVPVQVLGKPAQIHQSEMRSCARPLIRNRLAAVVKSRPNKRPRQPRPLSVETPPPLGCRPPLRRALVIRTDIPTLRIIGVDPARADGAALLRPDDRLIRPPRMEGLQVTQSDVVPPMHGYDIGESLAKPAIVHGSRHLARRVQLL